jgi:hypothetical protein
MSAFAAYPLNLVWCNRSKESVELVSRLLNKADVLVQNLAPGATSRLGLSHEALHEQHPKLIMCDISGYVADGPYRDKKGADREVDQAYPARWIGKVRVDTTGGLVLHGRFDEPRGDPGNTLTRAGLEEKALRRVEYSGAATPKEMAAVFAQIRDLSRTDEIGAFLG